MTEQDKDRQLLELVKTLRALHAEVVPLRIGHERHVERLREVFRHLTSTPCPLCVADGPLVAGKGADVVSRGIRTSLACWAACVMSGVVW